MKIGINLVGLSYHTLNGEHSKEIGILNSAEETWTEIVNRAGLTSKVIITPALRFTLLRENWLWWGDPEGNIISDKILA
jgi:hypothetical protein